MSDWDKSTKNLFALAMSIFIGATLFLVVYRFCALLSQDLPLSFLAAILFSLLIIPVAQNWINSNLAQ